MTITILGIPFSKQSARHTKSGIVYQTKKVKDAENNVRWQVIKQLSKGFIPYSKGVKVSKLWYIFPPTKQLLGSQKRVKQLESGKLFIKTTKPDLTDNLNKGLFDAMQGIVYNNDSQICEMTNVMKCYGLRPRIEIEIGEIE